MLHAIRALLNTHHQAHLTPYPPPLQNPQFVSQSPQSLMACLPLRFPPTHFSFPFPSVLHVICYAPQISETIWYLTLSAWLISLSIISSSPVHVDTKVGYSSFPVEAQYSIVYMDHIFFIHLSVEGHLGSFHSSVTVAIAAMNTGVQIALLFTRLHVVLRLLKSLIL